MKKILICAALVAVAAVSEAQSVSCSVSGLSVKQTALLTDFIIAENVKRHAAGLPDFTSFNEYCSSLMVSNVLTFAKQQETLNAGKVAEAIIKNGDQTALAGHCAAAGLSAGCAKAQVACFVLTGNVTCN